MCFNYKVSLLTFSIGTIFSILLINYGNKKYNIENNVFGIFLIFISAIQFMDFLFWIDINNKLGINKIATILGPFLNTCQPIILYLIKYIYYKPDIFTLSNYNLPVAILNLLYFIYFLFGYTKFITNSKLITQPVNGHLKWPWLKYADRNFYLILFGINIFYLSNFKYALMFFTIIYLFLFLSVKYFNYHAGEMWCFFGSFTPLILYFMSFYI
jgi:hypothetical protein